MNIKNTVLNMWISIKYLLTILLLINYFFYYLLTIYLCVQCFHSLSYLFLIRMWKNQRNVSPHKPCLQAISSCPGLFSYLNHKILFFLWAICVSFPLPAIEPPTSEREENSRKSLSCKDFLMPLMLWAPWVAIHILECGQSQKSYFYYKIKSSLSWSFTSYSFHGFQWI